MNAHPSCVLLERENDTSCPFRRNGEGLEVVSIWDLCWEEYDVNAGAFFLPSLGSAWGYFYMFCFFFLTAKLPSWAAVFHPLALPSVGPVLCWVTEGDVKQESPQALLLSATAKPSWAWMNPALPRHYMVCSLLLEKVKVMFTWLYIDTKVLCSVFIIQNR